eukprot:CAMPEP_0194328606 /NCGR_PEP_ID=MMETSP0171-20130528/45429_1 /TAXON_ID=218684 /ORGANISM="Corethron pennatum, Strain L29A3" /LENGTH=111 /DNA_ID=CAMNT_0039089015 /DNA_START=184 /DNA_END=516 /DNA_ORIENTATION=+
MNANEEEVSRRLSEAGCPHASQESSNGQVRSTAAGVVLIGASVVLFSVFASIVLPSFPWGALSDSATNTKLFGATSRGTGYTEDRNSYGAAVIIPLTFGAPTIIVFWLIGV